LFDDDFLDITPHAQEKNKKRAGGVAPVVEHLPSKREALSLDLRTGKK
jgi:hypothetical protein